MAHDVFVSYSSRDQATALAVVNGLESAGIRCWIAPRDIKAGDVWAQAIVDAIGAARAFVLVFSSHANHSGHVVNEVDAAIRKGAIVIPFRIENVMPEGAMEYHLRTRHWLDALTPDLGRHVGELVTTMKGLLGQPPGKAPPQTEFGSIAPKPQPSTSKSRPALESTESGIHVKIPKVGLPRSRGGLAVGAAIVLALAAFAGKKYLFGNRDLTGVSFDVRETTAGSDYRTTITATSIRFFESGRGIPPMNNRNYTNRFLAPQTHYLNTELGLRLEPQNRYLNIPVSCTIYNQAGGVSGSFTLEVRIAPNNPNWYTASGWGADNPGSWRPGNYKVECHYGDTTIARGSFEVLS